MKKYLIIFTGMFIFAGCASTFHKNVNAQTKFYLKSVTVINTSKCPAGEDNLTDEEVQKLFETDVKNHLCALRPCTETPTENDVTVEAKVVYKRIHNGEGFGSCKGHYGGSRLGYSYTLTKNGQEFHSDEDSDLVAKRSFFGNLKRIGTNLAGTGDKQEETDDINHMTQGLAERIATGKQSRSKIYQQK